MSARTIFEESERASKARGASGVCSSCLNKPPVGRTCTTCGTQRIDDSR